MARKTKLEYALDRARQDPDAMAAIHKAGSERHGWYWLGANIAAINAANANGLPAEQFKVPISQIVLRVLDSARAALVPKTKDGKPDLKALSRAIENTESEMERALEKLYPEGSTIRCTLQHGQRNPSSGVVINHPGGKFGYVRIRLNSRTQEVRDVSYTKIVA